MVATELPENENTSITNIVEYVAAEAYGRRGRDERWDLVTFAHYRRERTMQHSRPGGWRYTLGEADWRHLGRQQLEDLLGPYVAPEGG